MISLHVTMAIVSLKATSVMIMMTVETTVMKKDVVNVYMYMYCVQHAKHNTYVVCTRILILCET